MPGVDLLDVDAPTRCACRSCLALGGPARKRLAAAEREGTLRMLMRNDREFRAADRRGTSRVRRAS